MKTIIVDDEPVMISSFLRLSGDIEDIEIVGQFTRAEDALSFAEEEHVELAFLDVRMPGMKGTELAERLRELRPDILLVFISAYDENIREFNRIGADYYIAKPYRRETLATAMEKIRLLSKRQRRRIYIQTFGRFNVLLDGSPVRLMGKAKEILALVVTKRGYEISNEEIYSTLWEGRTYSNADMAVYYNAIRRLRRELEKAGIGKVLVPTARGQMVDTQLFDCDYYDWLDGDDDLFSGEFLSEYSWGEAILAGMMTGGRSEEF